MSVLDGKKTYKAMCSKGFTVTEQGGKDHKRIEFWHEGKLSRSRTKFSHNNQDLDDSLIGLISKQVGLTKKQFLAFAECTLTQEAYIEILRAQKLL